MARVGVRIFAQLEDGFKRILQQAKWTRQAAVPDEPVRRILERSGLDPEALQGSRQDFLFRGLSGNPLVPRRRIPGDTAYGGATARRLLADLRGQRPVDPHL